MYQKKHDDWNVLKKKLDEGDALPLFQMGEIWWCSLGANIGHEEDGKGVRFSRPVLVVRKFNKRLFWGVPLTTQIKKSPHYYEFELNNRQQCAMLTQMRLWDASRLTRKMGRISKNDLNNLKEQLICYLQ